VTVKLAVDPAHTVDAVGCTVIAGAVFTVKATRDEVAAGVHAPLTTQSNPAVAIAASALATPLIWRLEVVTPLYVDPFPFTPLEIATPFFLH
jgi:hypothetical protein